MSVEAISHGAPGQAVSHQFEDINQQNESYIVGMWSFLVTEIMFFGALFLAYVIYRTAYSETFYQAHLWLDVTMGAINTVILLSSSLTMALCVHAAQLGRRRAQINYMCVTILCAFGFLGIKYVEYSQKFEHHLFPGPNFQFHLKEGHGEPAAAPPQAEGKAEHMLGSAIVQDNGRYVTSGEIGRDTRDKAGMFFSLYFAMTGLHGIHVIVGILIMGVMVLMLKFNHPAMRDYMPTELAGLYWHFVDIVWIFLFPLYYLIPR